MKNYKQANKGMTFEEFVTFANKRYREKGLALIEKQHTHFIPIRDRHGAIVSCKVEEKATVDYMGRVGNTPIAIEAKHTSTDTLRWDAVQEHQNRFLTDFQGEGEGISLVLVSFDLRRFYAVPWPAWKAGRDAWQEAQRKGQRKAEIKTYTAYNPETGEFTGSWSTNGKASLKADDLHPDWEITMGGPIGLDYLRRYL